MHDPAATSAPVTAQSPVRASPPPRVLVATNAVLLVLLVLVTIGGRSRAAQPATRPNSRPHGEYTIVSPKTADGNTGALVVIDSTNDEMAVLAWDKTRRTLNVTGFRDLTADSTEVIGR